MKKVIILLTLLLSFASAKPAALQARLVNGVLVVNQPILFIDRKDGVVFSWCFEDTKIEGFKKSLPKRGKLKIKAPEGDINELCGNVQPLETVENSAKVSTVIKTPAKIMLPLVEILIDKDLNSHQRMEAFVSALEESTLHNLLLKDLKRDIGLLQLSAKTINKQLQLPAKKRNTALLKHAIDSWLFDHGVEVPDEELDEKIQKFLDDR